MHLVHGEPSFHLATPELDLDLTERGGHLAPVVFHLPGRDVSPYALAPWQPDEFQEIPLLSVLRGDFLCLPFGGQANGPPHGEPANFKWSLVAQNERSLHVAMDTTDTGARVEKIISTHEGHAAIYFEHQISNLAGDFNYGSHPILDLSGLAENSARITTSPFHWGSVYPGYFSDPADGATQALASGSKFSDLRQVDLAAGGKADLSRYPSRFGNDDLVMMASTPPTAEQPFAWSAAVLDGYVWFSLKNPVDFPATILWFSNGGRSASPWNNRHLGRIGIEDVCSYFSNGVDLARQDLLAAEGIPTSRHFEADQTVSLRLIHAAALVPEHFGEVSRITPHDNQSVALTSNTGAQIIVPIDWKFVL